MCHRGSIATGDILLLMSKNPILNALAAEVYIILLVLLMNFGIKMAGQQNSLIVPIAMISLFTLSTAVMGYLFCYQPIQLYFDGKKKQAVKLFLQTTCIFGGLTFVNLVLLFSRVFQGLR